jgi:hypothetical protein
MRLKREDIKHAVDAIAERDPEIGHTLDEMLSIGQIETLPRDIETPDERDFYFLFDNQVITVKKYIYINEGTVPIEQRLLIKYGEIERQRQLLEKDGKIGYYEAARDVREAGLRLMVTHEIDYAIARLRRTPKTADIGSNKTLGQSEIAETGCDEPKTEKSKLGPAANLITLLEKIKQDGQVNDFRSEGINSGTGPAVLYRGTVSDDTPACFVLFPFSMDTLMQVADLNFEFFHVRFLLHCLIRRLHKNLFACVVDENIVGLVFLSFREWLFYKCMEIKYIATVGGKSAGHDEHGPPSVRGVGTFLIAGVWLLWKSELYGYKDMVLDSEIISRRFYDSIGFHPRKFSEYVLKNPEGPLLKAILDTAGNCRDLKENVVGDIKRIIQRQITVLRKGAGAEKRKSAIAIAKVCLRSGAHPEFTGTALDMLIRFKKRIPEAKELICFALEHGSHETKELIHDATGACR